MWYLNIIPYLLPYLNFLCELSFSVAIYNWFLPDDHSINNDHKRSLKYTSTILSTLETAQICEGLSKEEHINALCEDRTPISGPSSVMKHTIPIERKHYKEDGPPFQAHVYIRSENCELLCSDIACSSCSKLESTLGKIKESKAKRTLEPLKANAPLSGSSKERLVTTVQKQRLVCKELESRIVELEKEIEKNTASPLTKQWKKIFWLFLLTVLQRKLLAMPKFGRRYHPRIILFACLFMQSLQQHIYRELRDSGILVLPSERTLRDYRNFFSNQGQVLILIILRG